MINMNSLKRIIPFAGVFLLAGAMAACGDDDGNNPIDAGDEPVVDAGAPDACVGGHGEGCATSPFAFQEHGEFRLEVFQTGPSGVGEESRVAAQAFFFTSQEPTIRPFGGKPIPLRTEIAAQGWYCNDYREGLWFDNGGTPAAQMTANSREYYDVGVNATLTNASDLTEEIVLAKFESNSDPQAATDVSGNIVHDILYQGDPEEIEVEFSTQYRPKVAGSENYLGLDLGFGEAAVTPPPVGELADENGEGDPKIYMPSNFQITEPAEEDYFAAAGLTFVRGQDFEITYTIDEPEGAQHPQVIQFVGWIKDRQVQAYCGGPFPASDATEDTFLIPFEVFEVIDPAPAADDEDTYFEIGRFTHAAWECQNLPQPHRLDLLGINCALSPTWQVVDAPPP